MTTNDDLTAVTVLGLGAMGSALATTLIKAGYRTTVWNRSPGRADPVITAGGLEATTAEQAVITGPVVIACLYDHASVRQVLDPLTDQLAGRTLINVTTTTPEESRELARWAGRHGIDFLDGGIMAVPAMIAGPGSLILYSGAREVFDRVEPVVRHWGGSRFLGADPGLAALCDLAILSGMYAMFAGFLHGAAMVASAGMPVTDYAEMAAPFLAAIVPSVRHEAEVVQGGDYTVPGQQSLTFSDLTKFVEASNDARVDPVLFTAIQSLIQRQLDAGHGDHGFARIFESLIRPTSSTPV